MSLLTSMFNAVSGMKNHARGMDVISNNIANVNTIGYKAQRLNFSDALAQTLRFASGPSTQNGGVNPMQIGLGTQIGSISTYFNQGNVETTGLFSDLAIDGDGFFIVKKNNTNYFTRNGQFVVDSKGTLTSAATGAVLQGYLANDGLITKSGGVENLSIPINDKVKAKQTGNVEFFGNLRSLSAKSLGDPFSVDVKNLSYGDNVTGTQVSLSTIAASDSLSDPSTVDIKNLGFGDNADTQVSLSALSNPSTIDIKNLSFGDSAATQVSLNTLATTDTVTAGANTYTYGTDFNTLDGLFSKIKNDVATFDYSFDSPSGSFTISDTGTPPTITSITSSNTDLQTALNSEAGLSSTKSFATTVTAGANTYIYGTDFNTLEELFSKIKNDVATFDYSFDSTSGSFTISDTGTPPTITSITSSNSDLQTALNSETSLSSTKSFFVSASANSTTVTAGANTYTYGTDFNTFEELFSKIKNDVPTFNYSFNSSSGSYTISDIGDPPTITSITSSNAELQTALNSATNLSNTKTFFVPSNVTSTLSIYDSQGNRHALKINFSRASDNLWDFNVIGDITTVDNTTTPSTSVTLPKQLGSGQLTFNSDGSFRSATNASITYPTTNGSYPSIEMTLDFGQTDSFQGVTQVEIPNSLTSQQDGYSPGDLVSLNIDLYGTIRGSYSNGQLKILAQIALARFRNNGGLDRAGDSMFAQTINSGDPLLSTLEDGATTKIVSGGLEASGVDLTEEFSRMIITQRGYQANARLITTSDEMTTELIGLKR